MTAKKFQNLTNTTMKQTTKTISYITFFTILIVIGFFRPETSEARFGIFDFEKKMCDKLPELTQKTEARIDEFRLTREETKEERKKVLETEWTLVDEAHTSERVTSDARREEILLALETRAETNEQKEAVSLFGKKINEITSSFRKGVDGAVNDYRKGVQVIRDERMTTIDTLVLDHQTRMESELLLIGTNCTNEVETITETELKNRLESIRKEFEIKHKEIESIINKIDELVKVRDGKINTAEKTYLDNLKTLEQDLREAFNEPKI